MRQSIRRAITLAATLSILVLAATLHAADHLSSMIELTPSAIQLSAGDSAQVLLTLRNPGTAALSNLQLHWITDLDLQVIPQSPVPKTLGPQGAIAWPVTITQKIPGRSVGKLHFWIEYTTASLPGTASASLDLQERPPLAIDKLVNLKLESAVDQLDENRSALLYVVVTNTASIPITVKAIQSEHPSFIQPDLSKVVSTVIEPEGAKTFPVPTTVTNLGFPGNQRIVFDVNLAWTDAGKPRTGSLSIAQTLPVSIFGESDLLKLMGVPSFLFLPGFLSLATFLALWNKVPTPRSPPRPAITLTLPESALIAVTLSLIATFIYPWFPPHRNYLHGYGVIDIMHVWFGSILFSLIAWIFAAGLFAAIKRYQAWVAEQKAARVDAERAEDLRRRTPTRNDSPLEMLDRMILNQITAPPAQAIVSLGGAPGARTFIVMPAASTAPDALVWVAPPITLQNDHEIKGDWSRSRLIEAISEKDNFSNHEKLRETLQSASNAGWKVVWGTAGAITRPTLVTAQQAKPADWIPAFTLVQL